MIDEIRKLMLPDSSGRGNHLPILLNWNKKVGKCKYVRFVLPGGDCVVHKDHLRSIMFIIGTDEEQRRMGKRRVTTVRTMTKRVEVVTTRDIRKGEKLVFPLTITVPIDIQDKVLEDESINIRG